MPREHLSRGLITRLDELYPNTVRRVLQQAGLSPEKLTMLIADGAATDDDRRRIRHLGALVRIRKVFDGE